MQAFVKTVWNMSLAVFVSLILAGCESSTLDDEDTDGAVSKFTVFLQEDGLADNTVTDMVMDYLRQGVWCATLNGISFYSYPDSALITFGAEYDIPDMETTSLAIDYLTGTVWTGTVTGAGYYSDDGLWYYLADMDSLVHRYILSLTAMSDGALWFGTKGGVSVWDYVHGWTSYTTASGLGGSEVTAVTADGRGDIWVGTTNGISVFDGDSWTQYGSSVLSSTYVRAIYRHYDGSMWCGTTQGITVYDGSSWKRYGIIDGLPSPGINDFAADRNKTLWVATDGGLAEFQAGKWVTLDLPEQVNSERITCLAADVITGILWIGTSKGLVRYIPETTE